MVFAGFIIPVERRRFVYIACSGKTFCGTPFGKDGQKKGSHFGSAKTVEFLKMLIDRSPTTLCMPGKNAIKGSRLIFRLKELIRKFDSFIKRTRYGYDVAEGEEVLGIIVACMRIFHV